MQFQQQDSEEQTSSSLPRFTQTQLAGEDIENGKVLRVTPEEVALAAAALETKRDAEHAWHETTLPLDEAINHLGLNATPHELAPEVVALRAARTARASQEQRNKQTRHAARLMGIMATLGLLGIVGVLWGLLSRARYARPVVSPPLTVLPIQKLARIPDNTPVHIDADTLARLAKGEITTEEVSVDTRAENSAGQSTTMFNNEWTLVKADGIVFVRGWATVEFALNISNDSTGGLFSSYPVWLPANNVVAVQVPVYRLAKQSSVHYLPTGKQADSATNSVLMAVNVASRAEAVSDLVQDDLLSLDKNFLAYSSPGWTHVDVSLKNNVLHLTGNATTAELKKLAEETAAKSLHRLHIAATVSNDLTLGQTDQ